MLISSKITNSKKESFLKRKTLSKNMSLERITHGIGNLTRTATATGLLGLGILGAGSVPVYAQQNVKYSSNIKTNYIQCRQSANEGEGGLPSEALSALGVLLGLSKDSGDQRTGAVLSTLGAMKHQKEVAREGRSKININQSVQGESESGKLERFLPAPGCVWANSENPNDFSVMERLGVGFVASYNGKFNKKYLKKAIRGKIDINNKFPKIKDIFYGDEKTVLAIDGTMKGKIRLEIYDPRGNKLHEVLWKCGDRFKAPCFLLPFGSDFDLTGWLIKNGGYGNYTAKWISSKGKGEVTKFEIVPASER